MAAETRNTEIVVVLDRSGSMLSIKSDMEGGFDAFIAAQREVPGKCKVTLTQFDDRYETLYECKALSRVPKLSLQPRGSTALLDALGRTIVATKERLKRKRNKPQVLFVVITDGHENASREFTRDQIHKLISEAGEWGNWEFIYLGANQDAIEVGTSLGFQARSSFTFDANTVGVKSMTDELSRGTARYRSTGNYSS